MSTLSAIMLVQMTAWHTGALPELGPHGMAIAWSDTRALTDDIVGQWVAELPDGERARYSRFQHAATAHEYVLGRRLVRAWLSVLAGCGPEAWIFTEGLRGRPEIASPATSLQFNLAHSGGIVACIVTNGVEAGVDVEDLQRRAITRDLWHRFCAPSEAADVDAQPAAHQQRRFLTYWTLKEAYLKARGLGIAVHLADIAFDLTAPRPRITFRESLAGTPDTWQFDVTEVAPHHLISWCVAGDPAQHFEAGVTHVPVSALCVPA